MRTSATYNFMWTRLTFSEKTADGFGVIRKAVGQLMFCRNGRKAQGSKATTDKCTIRKGLTKRKLTVKKMQLTAVLRVACRGRGR